MVRRCASLSSSWPRRRSTRPVVLASSSASLSLALFMCSSCPRRRVFTWERPVLLGGRKPRCGRGRGPLLGKAFGDPGPELLDQQAPARVCSSPSTAPGSPDHQQWAPAASQTGPASGSHAARSPPSILTLGVEGLGTGERARPGSTGARWQGREGGAIPAARQEVRRRGQAGLWRGPCGCTQGPKST